MNKLYNPELKERFLSTYDNEDTRTTIRYAFFKSYLIESVLDKDLADFNLDEIGKCIANSSPHNVQTAKATGRFLSAYISWAIEEGIREGSNIDPLKGITSSWFEQFVDKSKKIHYSLDEFINLLEEIPNAQDQAFLCLLWEGLNLEELREIHYNDINWNENKITVRVRNGEVINLDNRFMRYIENAYKSTTYRTFKETGEHTEKELLQSDYLFKNLKSPRTKEGVPVTNAVFYTRLANIKKEFDLEYLTPNACKQSGQIHMAAELYKENGKLEYEQFELIGDKYKVSKMTAGEYEYFNTTLMREYISSENLKELYNLDVKF